MKKIVAFAGSNSSRSINRQLINFSLENFKDYEVEILDLNDFEMPIFSIDREKKDGVPQSAVDFRKKLHEADGIIISLAEHNWTITVAMKNLLDWCSRVDMNIFDSKPMLLMSASISRAGGARAMDYMLTTKEKFNMNVVETFSLPSFNHTFADGRIIDEELNVELQEKIGVFINSLS